MRREKGKGKAEREKWGQFGEGGKGEGVRKGTKEEGGAKARRDRRIDR